LSAVAVTTASRHRPSGPTSPPGPTSPHQPEWLTTCPLPAPASGFALERSDDVGGDPAAVEPASLRQHPLPVDVALDHGRHEGQEPGDRHEPGGRRLITPSSGLSPTGAARVAESGVPCGPIPSGGSASADIPSADIPSADIPSADIPSADISSGSIPVEDVPVGGGALPLAHRAAHRRTADPVLIDICRRQVPGRRMAGLHHPPRRAALGDQDAFAAYHDMPGGLLQSRRPRVVPHRFLAGFGRSRRHRALLWRPSGCHACIVPVPCSGPRLMHAHGSARRTHLTPSTKG